MKIQWIEEIDVTVKECAMGDEVLSTIETFRNGYIHIVDILSNEVVENVCYVDMQFGDGSCAYGVPRDSYNILDKEAAK